MIVLTKKQFTGLILGGLLSVSAFAGVDKNPDGSSYDFFYHQEPLLDLVNDVRKLSRKNILFRPVDLKDVTVNYSRDQVELMTSFTEVLDVYGFGFTRMADEIFMIERIRSVEEVEAALKVAQEGVELGEVKTEQGDVPVEQLIAAYEKVEPNTDSVEVEPQAEAEEVAEVEHKPVMPAFTVSGTPAQAVESVNTNDANDEVVDRLQSPEFVKAVAGFQRRYITALMDEGFTKDEAMKMAKGFNPVSLVPSE